MPFRDRRTERHGIEHPILLAPRDGVSGGRFAATVSQAGGLRPREADRAGRTRPLAAPLFRYAAGIGWRKVR